MWLPRGTFYELTSAFESDAEYHYGARMAANMASHLITNWITKLSRRPRLWFLITGFGAHTIKDLTICCSPNRHVIIKSLANYFLHMSDSTLGLTMNQMEDGASGAVGRPNELGLCQRGLLRRLAGCLVGCGGGH